jgi:restriction system protein
MNLPDLKALTLPILRHVAAGQDNIAAMAAPIAKELGVSDEERKYAQVFPTGKRRPFYRRLRTAAHRLVKAGLLTAPARGRFQITERGRAALAAGGGHE